MTTRPLDRIVQIQERRVSRDRFGGEVESWAYFDDVWASVRLTGVREQYLDNADRELVTRNAIIRIRWRDDLDETMRLVYDDVEWDVLGYDEIGYRRFLDVTAMADVSRDAEILERPDYVTVAFASGFSIGFR